MISLASLTLAASQLTASYGFFGNLGGETTGVSPLVLGRLGHCELSPKQRLQAWVLYLRAGHVGALLSLRPNPHRINTDAWLMRDLLRSTLRLRAL
jgi:hypothetical protein